MYEIIRFDSSNSEAFHRCMAVRIKVFIEEQQIDATLEYDDNTVDARYLLVKKDGLPVATCRWRTTEKGIKMERFAVLASSRKSGLGSLLVKEALNSILPTDSLIYIHSQEGAVGFYERNNFKIKGEPFFEAGIRHYFMEYRG